MFEFATADLCDEHGSSIQMAELTFATFGAVTAFAGPIATVKVHEDNVLVRSALETPGDGRVLVVDGGGSMRCALVGDRLAQIGIDRGWVGLVIWGCIRDSSAITGMPIGIRALGTVPRRSAKNAFGEVGTTVRFAGVTFAPGSWLYADADGILVSEGPAH